MKIYILEKNIGEISYKLNEISTNLAHLAHLKIATKEILGFDINNENIDGVIVVLTKDALLDNSYIEEIKSFLETHSIQETRIITLEKIEIKEIENKISLQNLDSNTFKYYGKYLTQSQLLNVLQSFEKIEKTNEQKISSNIEHLIRTSHIDEGHFLEKDWKTEYLPIGASFGSEVISFDSKIQNISNINRSLEQLFIAKKSNNTNIFFSEDENNVLITLKKILQRGFSPPIDAVSEENILHSEKIKFAENSFPGDLTPEVEEKFIITQEMLSGIWASATKFSPRFNSEKWGESMLFNSNEELTFFKLFNKQPEVQRWLHPQYPLSELLINPADIGITTSEDQRRVDILFAPPWSQPIAIEILGEQHFDLDSGEDPTNPESSKSFQDRKKLVKIDMIGIPAKEISSGSGESLEKVVTYIQSSIENKKVDKTVNSLVSKLWEVSALNASLYEAIYDGHFNNISDEWVVGLNKNSINLHGIPMFLKLLSALSYFWNIDGFAPEKFIITDFDGKIINSWQKSSEKLFDYELVQIQEKKDFHVAISLEFDKSYLDHFTTVDRRIKDKNTIVTRTLSLPINLRDTRPEGSTQPTLKESDDENLRECLTTMLNFIFRKKTFREGQFEALNKILMKQDLLLLLPTGAGKSLVYQLISFILPGRVLVIDPIIALMNDQEDNLRSNGIDRVVAINSETYKSTEDMKIIMNSVEQGDNLIMLVAPERLLIPKFNQSLKTLFDGNIQLSLIVFDEAHCISEWGHDFRTSYLGIGERIKKLCNIYNFNPPILAMTGTASQPVIRDILVEADFKENQDKQNVIKAESYKREELKFSVELTSPEDRRRVLMSVLKKKIPNHFRIRPEELFTSKVNKNENFLGIVFVKTKPEMLRLYNDLHYDPEISRAGIGMYWGSEAIKKNWPKDLGDQKEYKKKTAKNFKSGNLRLLVSTIAFGMGIDIPNIRYVVHYGISSSLEAWYQEAGRAGRNRLPAYASAIFTEEDIEQSNFLLVGDREEVRLRHSSLFNQWSDDIKVNLSFHWMNWIRIIDELSLIKKLISEVGKESLDRQFRGNHEFKSINNWVYAKIKNSEKSIQVEQLIYRLYIVGLIEDWQKNYGERESTFFLSIKDKKNFLQFEQFRNWLERRSPRDRNSIIDTLLKLNNLNTEDNFFDNFKEIAKENLNINLDENYRDLYFDLDNFSKLLLASVNIALYEIYTSVESARRRKILEIVEFSRNKVSNNEIHNGFEQYFTDGPAADLFRQLYDKQEYEIEPWFQAYGSLTAEQRVDSRGDIVRYADESSNYLAIDWLLIFNSIESGNIVNLSSELTLAIQNCDKELITNNKYETIFELWQKCFVINSDFEISEALLFHSINYFINLSDINIVENYIEISLNFLSTYFQNNIESDASNFIFLKLINNKLEMLNENLIKHV